MKQILNVNNVEWKGGNNWIMKRQYLLLSVDQLNLVVKTISNKVSEKFNFLQCGLWCFVLVEIQESSLISFAPNQGLAVYHVGR